jgi:two-component system response regulator YesN
MRLLILDDDIQIREGIHYGIDWKSIGIDEVKSVGDGVIGMEIATSFMPNIIISDVRMPGMDGLEFLRRIKELLPLSKVIILSGYDDFEYLHTAIKYKADAYELKPINVKNLLNIIEEQKSKIIAEGEEDLTPVLKDEPEYSFRINKAIDYINTHFAENISTVTMSKMLMVTPNYFSALFKKETGCHFSNFLNNIRLKSAVYLLEHTDYLVYEIAELCGFHDYIYFSQNFKKAFGVSPSKYRKKRKK